MVEERKMMQFILSKIDTTEEELIKEFGEADYSSIIEKQVPSLKQIGLDVVPVLDESERVHFVIVLPETLPNLTDQEMDIFLFLTYIIRKKRDKGLKMDFNEVKERLGDYSDTLKSLIEKHGLFKKSEDNIIVTPKNTAIITPILDSFITKMDQLLEFS